MIQAPVTALTAAVLVPVFVRLALGVIGKRKAYKVAVGAGGQPELEAAIRAHGNFTEYVPFGLLLLLCAELNGAWTWLVAVPAVMLVLGRILHAQAIPAGDLGKRVKAMKLTFGALATAALVNVFALLRGLL